MISDFQNGSFYFFESRLHLMTGFSGLFMEIKSYSYKAEFLDKDYLFSNSLLPCVSVISGIFMCKMACDLTQLISSYYHKGYASLTKIKRFEWNNRGMSTGHAVYITVMSLYLLFFSDVFSDKQGGLVTFRSSSPLSCFTLGVSIGYFIADLTMILWSYPSLGGMEYVIHHLISLISISYAMLSGEGQFYTYMMLISEATTPGVNLRWFLDTAGMRRSTAYLINGVLMFFSWLLVRILLFIYVFYHQYTNFDKIEHMHTFGYILVLLVPSILALMNIMWFGKILKGITKVLRKRQ